MFAWAPRDLDAVDEYASIASFYTRLRWLQSTEAMEVRADTARAGKQKPAAHAATESPSRGVSAAANLSPFSSTPATSQAEDNEPSMGLSLPSSQWLPGPLRSQSQSQSRYCTQTTDAQHSGAGLWTPPRPVRAVASQHSSASRSASRKRPRSGEDAHHWYRSATPLATPEFGTPRGRALRALTCWAAIARVKKEPFRALCLERAAVALRGHRANDACLPTPASWLSDGDGVSNDEDVTFRRRLEECYLNVPPAAARLLLHDARRRVLDAQTSKTSDGSKHPVPPTWTVWQARSPDSIGECAVAELSALFGVHVEDAVQWVLTLGINSIAELSVIAIGDRPIVPALGMLHRVGLACWRCNHAKSRIRHENHQCKTLRDCGWLLSEEERSMARLQVTALLIGAFPNAITLQAGGGGCIEDNTASSYLGLEVVLPAAVAHSARAVALRCLSPLLVINEEGCDDVAFETSMECGRSRFVAVLRVDLCASQRFIVLDMMLSARCSLCNGQSVESSESSFGKA